MRVDPLTVDSEQAKYSAAYTQDSYRSKRHSVQNRTPRMLELKAGDSYLDVSCGRGEMLGLMRRLNPRVTVRGTEFTQALVDPARNIVYGHLPELAGVEPADYVSCYEILEHLRPHDVIPALERLVELANKQVWITTNDRKARSVFPEGVFNLHLSRLPLRWWISQLDRIGRERNIWPLYQLWRPHKPEIRNWFFGFDKRRPYDPSWIDDDKLRKDIIAQGYTDPDAMYHFWHNPVFPVSALKAMPESKQVDLPHVQALWADLDKRGIQSPLLVHNIPGQTTREYWVRCGNHRRNWALARGIKTVPAIIYGCSEHMFLDERGHRDSAPYTLHDANRLLRDGQLTMDGPDGPNVVGIRKWEAGEYP